MNSAQDEIASLKSELVRTKHVLAVRDAYVQSLETELHQVYTSTSWSLTAPVRNICDAAYAVLGSFRDRPATRQVPGKWLRQRGAASARALVARIPFVSARIFLEGLIPAPQDQREVTKPSDLSLRAREIYLRFKAVLSETTAPR